MSHLSRILLSWLVEIPGPTNTYSVSIDEEDYNDQLGSAEKDQDDDFLINAQVNGKSLGLSTLEPPKKSTHSSERSNHNHLTEYLKAFQEKLKVKCKGE
ncbi:hypothetical protein HUJ05_000787 [Dendroctonus ponderosae]|nr:hypothetical protein HUJ05_000787 [Dendroctonus ponderosae]